MRLPLLARGLLFAHGLPPTAAVDTEKLRCMIQAVHAGGSKAFVRVGGHMDRLGIQQSLDLGADGILVPCVNTAEDVALAVSCAKYPVDGPGSDGGTRSVYLNLRPQRRSPVNDSH